MAQHEYKLLSHIKIDKNSLLLVVYFILTEMSFLDCYKMLRLSQNIKSYKAYNWT